RFTEKVEVHREERKLRADIAGAQPGAEFDAVKNHDIVCQADMLGTEITVPIAHSSPTRARGYQALVLGVKCGAEILNRAVLPRADGRPYKWSGFAQALGPPLPDYFGSAVDVCILCPRVGVKSHELGGEPIHRLCSNPSVPYQRRKHLSFRQTPH